MRTVCQISILQFFPPRHSYPNLFGPQFLSCKFEAKLGEKIKSARGIKFESENKPFRFILSI